jgi:hypothetical protein
MDRGARSSSRRSTSSLCCTESTCVDPASHALAPAPLLTPLVPDPCSQSTHQVTVMSTDIRSAAEIALAFEGSTGEPRCGACCPRSCSTDRVDALQTPKRRGCCAWASTAPLLLSVPSATTPPYTGSRYCAASTTDSASHTDTDTDISLLSAIAGFAKAEGREGAANHKRASNNRYAFRSVDTFEGCSAHESTVVSLPAESEDDIFEQIDKMTLEREWTIPPPPPPSAGLCGLCLPRTSSPRKAFVAKVQSARSDVTSCSLSWH